ncbi:MAG TPA: WXG100 family type VII secretion target [Micromonosporaceae bacterium]|nr:WXG100 family type VII secretion target [Micromonosporaceae bacterium]
MRDEPLLVNFTAMSTASANIAAAIRTLHDQLAELEQSAAPLVSTWEGSARSAYDQRQAQWRAAAAELTATLTDIKQALDDSAADYAYTERRNSHLFE